MTRVTRGSSAEIPLQPKELLVMVRRIVQEPPLSMGVEDERDGTIVTGWKRYRGTWHIARYWQERTRYRIQISPDFNEPTARSRLSVTAETDQRAAEGQRWDREPRVPRPKREAEVLNEILRQVQLPPSSPSTQRT